jgi:hypothetical protein
MPCHPLCRGATCPLVGTCVDAVWDSSVASCPGWTTCTRLNEWWALSRGPPWLAHAHLLWSCAADGPDERSADLPRCCRYWQCLKASNGGGSTPAPQPSSLSLNLWDQCGGAGRERERRGRGGERRAWGSAKREGKAGMSLQHLCRSACLSACDAAQAWAATARRPATPARTRCVRGCCRGSCWQCCAPASPLGAPLGHNHGGPSGAPPQQQPSALALPATLARLCPTRLLTAARCARNATSRTLATPAPPAPTASRSTSGTTSA